MASNTDATLCYGYLLDDGHPVTWDPEAIYQFVRLVNICSLQYPIWLVAVEASVTTANRGYPKVVDQFSLVLNAKTDALWPKILDAFCKTHITSKLRVNLCGIFPAIQSLALSARSQSMKGCL